MIHRFYQHQSNWKGNKKRRKTKEKRLAQFGAVEAARLNEIGELILTIHCTAL